MRKNTMDQLNRHGKNTDGYLSLKISKGELPDGAEVVVMVRDEKTGDLHPLKVSVADSPSTIAKNSRFYQRVMEDGHLFNPYIHRRYIAAQFRRLYRDNGFYEIQNHVSRSFNWKYAIGILCKEVHALANLERHDHAAFNERSRFFTLETCARILRDYAVVACLHIDKYTANTTCNTVFIPGCNSVLRQNVRPLKHRFSTLPEKAKACYSYRQLDDLLSHFDWCELSNRHLLPASFTTPFVEEGAFYTLKHHIMFEGLRLWALTQQESLEVLLSHSGGFLSLYHNVMN